jgi:glyoxylase-like metal-dependent hydrolase (beta-lactamase superfamily II)
MLRVGDIAIEAAHDGTALLRSEMWVGSDWTEHRHLLDDDGAMVVPVGAFVVRTGDRLVLLDAGVGDIHDEMFDGGALLDSLRELDVAPDDIDTVVVSHLHGDHMGWLERDGAPVFANATVHIGAADWGHFVERAKGGRRRATRLRAIEDHVELVDRDGVTIAPGITTRLTPGHTPGHLSTVIASRDERMIVLGDALHCPAQLTNTEWEFISDVDPALARATRAALVQEAERPGTHLLPCHFPGMQSARLVPASAGAQTWVLGG